MTSSILSPGDVVLAVHRRLFDEDPPRFFLGRVDAYEAGIASVVGRTWVYDAYEQRVLLKDGERCKLLALASGTLLVYRLGGDVRLDRAELVCEPDGSIWVTDHAELRLDLSERPRRRA